jgi:hypothetical protein
VVMYLRRSSIQSGVESGVECSETSNASGDACISRRMRLEMHAFPDACVWRRMRFQMHALLDASLSIFLRSYVEDI